MASLRLLARPLLALLLVAGSVHAGPRLGVPRPEIYKLVGTWGPPRPDHTASADLTVEVEGALRRFQVEDAITVVGDRIGSELLAEVSQYRPALRLSGPKELLARLSGAADRAPVTIVGYRPLGSRRFMVSDVDVDAP